MEEALAIGAWLIAYRRREVKGRRHKGGSLSGFSFRILPAVETLNIQLLLPILLNCSAAEHKLAVAAKGSKPYNLPTNFHRWSFSVIFWSKNLGHIYLRK